MLAAEDLSHAGEASPGLAVPEEAVDASMLVPSLGKGISPSSLPSTKDKTLQSTPPAQTGWWSNQLSDGWWGGGR